MFRVRVMVGFDSSTPGHNALWWAVSEAARRGAVLFVVHARPPLPLPGELSMLMLPGLASEAPYAAYARRRTNDALLLVVGEVPPQLEVRVVPVMGSVALLLPELADRPEDLVVVATSRSRVQRLLSWGRWRSRGYWRRRCRGELLLALDDRGHEFLPRINRPGDRAAGGSGRRGPSRRGRARDERGSP